MTLKVLSEELPIEWPKRANEPQNYEQMKREVGSPEQNGKREPLGSILSERSFSDFDNISA
jgi:hypothetical protein